MLDRRQFLNRTLAGSSLLAVGSQVPQFLANTALAAGSSRDTILVVVEMNGGNDGLNTVIPYTDDLYHKYRPTLRFKKEEVVRVDDNIGLHPAFRTLEPMLRNGQLSIVQGIGYPNPDRSHFESMDIWQSADVRRRTRSGWLGRTVPELQDKGGGVPAMQIGASRLPLALQGSAGVVSINNQLPYKLELGNSDPARVKARRTLMEELSQPEETAGDDLLQFVRRRQLQTYTTLDRLAQVLQKQQNQQQNFLFSQQGQPYQPGSLPHKLNLVANLILSGLTTRVYYVMLDGFDTHSSQGDAHRKLLGEVSDGISNFFRVLGPQNEKRALVLTFSEFGRRVQENGSKGTDHGSGSCLFVAGPMAKGGVVGKHPSLKREDLDYEVSIVDRQSGDLKYHTDFRKVYATVLDRWLGVDSTAILGAKFEHLDLIKG